MTLVTVKSEVIDTDKDTAYPKEGDATLTSGDGTLNRGASI
jgi:hypothetical protein